MAVRQRPCDTGRHDHRAGEAPALRPGDESGKVEEEALARLARCGDFVGSHLRQFQVGKPLHQFPGPEQDGDELGVALDARRQVLGRLQARGDLCA